MQRNDLITLLAEKDNDTVTVSVRGFLVEVSAVTDLGGHIVLILDPDEESDTLRQVIAGDPGPGAIRPPWRT